jgi:hypothetical protein
LSLVTFKRTVKNTQNLNDISKDLEEDMLFEKPDKVCDKPSQKYAQGIRLYLNCMFLTIFMTL